MKKAFAYLLLILSMMFLAIVLLNFTHAAPVSAQSGTAESTGFWIGKLLVLVAALSAFLLSALWIRKLGKSRGGA
jgi:hypothetical protein